MKKYLIDSSSLISLVRYYHPFDEHKRLMNFVQHNFEEKNWLLLDSVRNEIKKVAKGLVVTTYPFLKNEIKPLKMVTEIAIPLYWEIDKNWVNYSKKKELKSETNYSRERSKQINGADFQLILTAMEDKDTYIIVTEETETPNDNKLFKKIPMICKHEKVKCIALPKLFDECGIGVQFSIK